MPKASSWEEKPQQRNAAVHSFWSKLLCCAEQHRWSSVPEQCCDPRALSLSSPHDARSNGTLPALQCPAGCCEPLGCLAADSLLWQRGQSGLQDIAPGRDTNPFQFLESGLSLGVLIKQCFQAAPKTKPWPGLGAGARGGGAAAWQPERHWLCSAPPPAEHSPGQTRGGEALQFTGLGETFPCSGLCLL